MVHIECTLSNCDLTKNIFIRYNDGISWHDTACFRKKSFICEDSEVLMRRARMLSPTVVL